MQSITESAQALSRRLGIKTTALEAILGYWVRRIPGQDREDVAQNLALALLEAKPANPKYAFAICRNKIVDWWRAYSIRQHYSLDLMIDGDGQGDGAKALGDTVASVSRYELTFEQVEGKLDGASLYRKLPRDIKLIVAKRMKGKRTSNTERSRLARWLQNDGTRELLGVAS